MPSSFESSRLIENESSCINANPSDDGLDVLLSFDIQRLLNDSAILQRIKCLYSRRYHDQNLTILVALPNYLKFIGDCIHEIKAVWPVFHYTDAAARKIVIWIPRHFSSSFPNILFMITITDKIPLILPIPHGTHQCRWPRRKWFNFFFSYRVVPNILRRSQLRCSLFTNMPTVDGCL